MFGDGYPKGEASLKASIVLTYSHMYLLWIGQKTSNNLFLDDSFLFEHSFLPHLMVNTIFLKNIIIIMMVSKGDGISIHCTNGEFGCCCCLVRIKSRKNFGGIYAFFLMKIERIENRGEKIGERCVWLRGKNGEENGGTRKFFPWPPPKHYLQNWGENRMENKLCIFG